MEKYNTAPFGKSKHRRGHSFAIITGAFFVIILAVIWTVLSYLWSYLEAYESRNPDSAVQKYISIYRNNDFESIAKACNFEYDYFNDADAFARYMAGSFGGDLSGVKATRTANDGENLRYNLKNGDKLVAALTVSPNGKLDKYGLEGWTIAVSGYEPKHSARVCVPSGANAYIDGKLMPPELLTEGSFDVSDYDDLDDKTLRPSFQTYAADGLLLEPAVTAELEGVKRLSVSQKAGTHYALPAPDEALSAEIKLRAEEIAVKYCLYAIQDVKFSELEPFLVKESAYYRAIKNFVNEWAIEHTFAHDNLKFGEIIQYDESHIVVNISFSYHIKLRYKTNDYDVKYKMSLLKQDGVWLLAGMKIF